MDVAWVSQFQGGQQAFLTVSAEPDAQAPQEGASAPLNESYCVRVLDGRLPAIVPNSAADPVTRDLAITDQLGIGSYVGAPIRGHDGAVRGMLCCTSRHASPELAERDRRVIEMLAQVVGELNADGDSDREAGEGGTRPVTRAG